MVILPADASGVSFGGRGVRLNTSLRASTGERPRTVTTADSGPGRPRGQRRDSSALSVSGDARFEYARAGWRWVIRSSGHRDAPRLMLSTTAGRLVTESCRRWRRRPRFFKISLSSVRIRFSRRSRRSSSRSSDVSRLPALIDVDLARANCAVTAARRPARSPARAPTCRCEKQLNRLTAERFGIRRRPEH